MQLPVCTSIASHSGAAVMTSRNSGPTAGNLPIAGTLYSPSNYVGYLNEYVRFMQTENKRQTQHKIFGQQDIGENNTNLAWSVQQASSNRSGGQSGTFTVEGVGKKPTIDFCSHVARNTHASSWDFTVKCVGDSPTSSHLDSIQKSALVAEHLDSAVEIKYHMIKNDEIGHKKTEYEKVKNKETKSGKIETASIKIEKVEAKMLEDKKTETKIIKTETSSDFVASTAVSMAINPAFVSGVGSEELSRANISMTGSTSASDSSEAQSHKELMNAIGGLLELKNIQGVAGTSGGTLDESPYSVQETMAALQKFTAVSVTPISSVQNLKLSNNVQLDTGQASTILSNASVPERALMPSTSKGSAISGHTCSVYKVDIPCVGSKTDKSKSEPKPQTEFRIQINCKNEMYLCNTETGEIKPLNTAKSAKKWSRTNSRSTPVQVEPSSNVSADSKITFGELPLHPVQVSGTYQNVIAKTTDITVKADQSRLVTETAPVNIPMSGMSGTPSPVPKLSLSHPVSKPGSVTFPDKPVTSVSKLNQSESVVKPSEGNKSSVLMKSPHVPKLVMPRKPTATQSMPSKWQSAETMAANHKPNRRKPTYIIHNAHGKMARHTIELQEALESCVESMLATDKDDNSVTRGHENMFDTTMKDDTPLPFLLEGGIQTSDMSNSKGMLHMTQPDSKQWPSLGHEVTVVTTAATPPLLEASPPVLEPAGSQQMTSTGEEGSSHPPQLIPESSTSIRNVSMAHITAKNRKCRLYTLNYMETYFFVSFKVVSL